MAPLLEIRELAKSYGDNPALRGVSLSVEAGEVFGLLGPNGAGKTTLIRILLDIIRPDSGQVILFGEPFRRQHLDRIAYLPEERGLYRKRKVLEVMIYFGRLRGLSRVEARHRGLEWLEKVGMPEVAGWKVERLSKGMGQKVQIAATLMIDPELCVLDEPFSGLDPVNLRLIRKLIRERRRAGRCTILSTHQMNLVEKLCDRVGLIHRGKLVVYGEVNEVRRRYSLPEVRVALGGNLPELDGVVRSTAEGPGRWRLLLDRGASAQSILQQLLAAGTTVDRFERILAPIEDIFVQVVEGAAA